MTQGWSLYIIAFVVLNIVGATWLLWWTGRRRPGDPPADATSHHWDGDLTEYNKPMPRWWINLFYLTIVFGIGYLVWYPGFGSFAGTSKWTSRDQLAAEQSVADKKLAAAFAGVENRSIDQIAKDPNAVDTGRRIFANTCAMCHGSDARGANGFPNLTDDKWQWGGTPEQILATVQYGRQAAMPPLAQVLGSESNITATAIYVQSLSGQKVDPLLANDGKQVFSGICAGCHGADGKGNQAIGSADLTDDYWLYRGGVDAIRAAIHEGHNGQMPAHKELLGETRTRLVAAYVYSLSHPNAASSTRPAVASE
jgi:cytochrome c oxidase cbb3-type subunit 3